MVYASLFRLPSIPSTICTLDYNGLTGSIPTENGLLTSLRIFDVKYNEIEGTIPTSVVDTNPATC
jgi:hypothetical protein